VRCLRDLFMKYSVVQQGRSVHKNRRDLSSAFGELEPKGSTPGPISARTTKSNVVSSNICLRNSRKAALSRFSRKAEHQSLTSCSGMLLAVPTASNYGSHVERLATRVDGNQNVSVSKLIFDDGWRLFR